MKLKIPSKNKKGSHIGLVVSFVIFVVAVIFLYIIIKPVVTEKRNEADAITTMSINAMSLIEADVYTVRVFNDTVSPGTTLCFTTPEDFTNVMAIGDNGAEVASSIDGANTVFIAQNGMIKLRYGPYFNKIKDLGTGNPCTQTEVKSVINEKRVVEKKILDLLDEINNSEDDAKKDLGVPSAMGFAVLFDYMNGTIIGKDMKRDLKKNIYAREFLVNYLGLDANEKTGKLIIKVW